MLHNVEKISFIDIGMFECARMTEYPVISLGDLNFNYILDETLSTNPIHYIEQHMICTS